MIVIPDSITPAIGWKTWGFSRSLTGSRPVVDGYIFSPLLQVIWEPNQRLEAHCSPKMLTFSSTHQVVDSRCCCGIYAVKTPREMAAYSPSYPHEPHVIGRIYLWGRTIEGTTGWRAQYAYPADLYVVREDKKRRFRGGMKYRLMKELQIYGVPVTLVSSFEEAEMLAKELPVLA